jgi:hypothetical protein
MTMKSDNLIKKKGAIAFEVYREKVSEREAKLTTVLERIYLGFWCIAKFFENRSTRPLSCLVHRLWR